MRKFTAGSGVCARYFLTFPDGSSCFDRRTEHPGKGIRKNRDHILYWGQYHIRQRSGGRGTADEVVSGAARNPAWPALSYFQLRRERSNPADLSRKSYRNTGHLNVIEAQSPDVVIIMLGTNDSKQKYWDAERYEEQYLALIDELHNLPGHPYLYLMAPPEAFPAEEGEILYGINNDVIGGEIRNLVPDIAEQSGCGTLDLYALTQDHPEYFVDGIHPTEEGYALIAQMWLRIRSGQTGMRACGDTVKRASKITKI